MFYYFGYGSNMNLTSLRAKGVEPVSSHRAVISGWRLRFNVEHFFRHEGGMGNIEQTGNPEDAVQGLAHLCPDEALAALDEAEAYGIGYDRVELKARTDKGSICATAYVGYPSFINNDCMPTRRYLNILLKGAQAARLDAAYIDKLGSLEPLRKRHYPRFEFPELPADTFDENTICKLPLFTAIGGAVFDMTNARPRHEYVKTWFGGRDVTLFHLKRMDSSDGTECLEDLKNNRVNIAQRQYINEYLHEFHIEYEYVGLYNY